MATSPRFLCRRTTEESRTTWRPVLVVEEAGVPEENHRTWASNWSNLSLAAASQVHPFL